MLCKHAKSEYVKEQAKMVKHQLQIKLPALTFPTISPHYLTDSMGKTRWKYHPRPDKGHPLKLKARIDKPAADIFQIVFAQPEIIINEPDIAGPSFLNGYHFSHDAIGGSDPGQAAVFGEIAEGAVIGATVAGLHRHNSGFEYLPGQRRPVNGRISATADIVHTF